MKIINKTTDPNIAKAIELFEKHYADNDFLLAVARHTKFNECPHVGWTLAYMIKNGLDQINVTVTTFKPFYWRSKTIAKHYGDTLAFNSRKAGSVMDRLETMMHENLHEIGFHHKGEQNNEFNRGTVPYAVAGMFRAHVEMILHKEGAA